MVLSNVMNGALDMHLVGINLDINCVSQHQIDIQYRTGILIQTANESFNIAVLHEPNNEPTKDLVSDKLSDRLRAVSQWVFRHRDDCFDGDRRRVVTCHRSSLPLSLSLSLSFSPN